MDTGWSAKLTVVMRGRAHAVSPVRIRAARAALLIVVASAALIIAAGAGYLAVLQPRLRLSAYAERLERALPNTLGEGLAIDTIGRRNLLGLHYPLTIVRVYKRREMTPPGASAVTLRIVAWGDRREFDYPDAPNEMGFAYPAKIREWVQDDGALCKEIELLVSSRIEFQIETCALAGSAGHQIALVEIVGRIPLKVFVELDRNAPAGF